MQVYNIKIDEIMNSFVEDIVLLYCYSICTIIGETVYDFSR